MIVGIEQTTDLRFPETRIVRLRTVKAALIWLDVSGGYAWPGAADPRLPVQAQNHHRRLREAYEMPKGWRMPTPQAIRQQRGARPWEDQRKDADIIAAMVRRSGSRIDRNGGGQ